jgi:phage protein U
MFAQLGDIQFTLVDSPDFLTGTKRIDYAEHQIIEGKSRLQYIGEALEAKSMRIRFHASFCDPDARLTELNDAAGRHEALPLVMGNGAYEGHFVIEEVRVDLRQAFADGTPIAIDVDVQLKEWAGTAQTAAGGKKAATSAVKKDTEEEASGGDKDDVSLETVVRQSS